MSKSSSNTSFANSPSLVDYMFFQKTRDGEKVWAVYYQDSPQWAGWQPVNFNTQEELTEAHCLDIAKQRAEEINAQVVESTFELLLETSIHQTKPHESDMPIKIYMAEVMRNSVDPILVEKKLFALFDPIDALYTDLPLIFRDAIAKRYKLEHLKDTHE